jgi:hypothetical protein
MNTIEWWPGLDSATKAALIAHNGEAVTPDLLDKITAAGGVLTPDAWWAGESGKDGFFLSDEAVDWIEAVANDESD